MLENTDARATIAVKDLEAARKFYEGTLGLKRLPTRGDQVLSFQSGSANILVYKSQFAGTNRATSLTWSVADVPGTVQALKQKGVTFEHYDIPGLTRQGDLHVAGEFKTAWFKDPDGNILALVNQ